MAELLISAALDQLASFARQELQREVRLVVGVSKDIQSLTTTFTIVQALMNDAEQKQVRNEAVKAWLKELKDIAYDTEDVLDEWGTKFYGTNMDDHAVWKNKVRNYIFSPCSCFQPVVIRHNIGHRIKEIRGRLNAIANERGNLELIERRGAEEPQQRMTISMIKESEVCGRDFDKEIIISKLLSESSNVEVGVPVISITGMGGLGKTTLAQYVFNDENVKSHFEKKIWICVSEPFDVKRLVGAIIEAIGDKIPDVTELEALHQQLRISIAGKRFLLVLDDVWTEDQHSWEQLKLALDLGARGSRIVVTTRNDAVAKTVGTTYKHRLQILSDDDCWLLFSRIAFESRTEEDHQRLSSIGRKISNKCKGLPLCVKTIGSLMRYKRSTQDWQDVLASDIWELPIINQGILPPLLLSYYALPSHLKRCFTYCSIFPKDSSIEKNVVIKMWMAQGFIQSTMTREMEVIGRDYFDDLAMRSFFQDLVIENGNIARCKMHDLMHDFANFLGHNECSIVESNDTGFRNVRTRHLTLMCHNQETDSVPHSIWNVKDLRTFLIRLPYSTCIPKFSADLKLLQHLTSLRILDLSRARFEELPNEVGNLILLRYLDLSHTSLQKLPETVSNLRNLQTLILYGCLLRELPKGLGKLVNLRHLENECTFKLERLPPGIGRLTHLQTLSKFIVSEECKISYLKDLNKLKGSLEIINIKGETQEAGAAELKSKEHLRVLKLRFSDASFNDCHDQVHRVLDLLEPHPNLEELEIYSYNGSKFPSWMEFRAKESPYIMLRRLTISHCEQWKVLPPLVRLESLEYLSLSGLDPVALMGLDGAVRDGGGAGTLVFPKLRKLLMSDMENWEEWVMRTTEGITIMPCLQTLEIMNCPMLKSLPHQILSDSLRELSITDCPVLRITCIPNFLETLNLYGDSGSLSRSLPFIANHNLLLNSLYIDNSPHLTLPQGLAQLTELTTIHISHSKSLVCMSEELKQLTLLELLYIEDCPILASRCKKEVGEDWPIISHIPVIQIDDNMIHGGQLIFTTAYLSRFFEVPGFTVSKIFSNADRSLNKQLRDKKEKKRDYWEEVVSETLPATVGEEDSSSC